MVKILIFMPHSDMKGRFEKAVKKLCPWSEDIKMELIHVYGTPDSLSENGGAEIMVARGMTYERLKILFPHKHIVELRLTSFDIVDALARCKEIFAPRKIALCLQKQEFSSMENLEALCNASIEYYDISDEESCRKTIEKIKDNSVDAVVGAGTICNLCDKAGIQRIHIETKDNAIEQALAEAVNAARTINNERAKADMMRIILNNSEDAIIAINEEGRVLAINNQAYISYQLSTKDNYLNRPIEVINKNLKWRQAMRSEKETSELLTINGKNYFVQYKPIMADHHSAGILIITQNTQKIMETETKIRRGLSEKGLTSKYTFHDIIGQSATIKENIAMAKRYSNVDSNVLIIGETGTGKELFAHSIHAASKRSNQPFVALNCAALPENLLESELFGYEPGAFSGASRNGKIGLFELAHKGTIFLDEIGEIPVSLQAKLLRVLQEKEIRRIGSDRVLPIDVRVISATNIDIETQIEEGNFRSDLYYRLNLLDICLSPLRERREDIMTMVDFYMLRFACEIGKAAPRVSLEASNMLTEYDWPGNVRQLRNICERLTVMNDTGEIDESSIRQLKIFKNLEKKEEQTFCSNPCQEIELNYGLQPRVKKKDLAEELGVSRTTLWRMMKQQGERTGKNSN